MLVQVAQYVSPGDRRGGAQRGSQGHSEGAPSGSDLQYDSYKEAADGVDAGADADDEVSALHGPSSPFHPVRCSSVSPRLLFLLSSRTTSLPADALTPRERKQSNTLGCK